LLTGGAGATTKGGTAIANSLRSGNVAARAGKAGLLGAASGAAAGFGAGSGLEDRLDKSGDSAVVGGLVGGAIPAVGAVAGKVLGKPIERTSDYVSRKIAASTGEVPAVTGGKAINKVAERLSADLSPSEIDKVLNSYAATEGKSLVQTGGARTANLAEGAAQYPSGGAKAAEFFDEAISSAPDKLKGTIAKTISPSSNYYDTVDDIVKQGRERASPMYSAAFKANQAIESPIISRILQTPEGKSALSEAAKNLQNEMTLLSRPDPELTMVAKELLGLESTGSGVGRGLKLRTLDEIKKSMDNTINQAYRAGDEAQARRIINLKSGLVSELDAADKSGLYAKARRASGDYITNKNAAEAGLTFLRDDPQVIAKNFAGYGPTERKAYKVGVLKTLRNDFDNKVDGQNVARIFNKPATRQKLESILSPKEYTKLMADAKATDDLYKLRNKIVGGSPTAGRQIAAEEFSGETGEFITELATKGATRTVIDRGVGIIARQFDGLSDKSAREVAEILYETDPKKKYEIVRDLANLTKSKGSVIQSTQAAQKLKAFYSLSDAIQSESAGQLALPAGSLATIPERQPTQIIVNPNGQNPYSQELPEVNLPQIDFNDLIPKQAAPQASLMDNIKQAESAGDPNAKNPNSTASGTFQFTDPTWKSAVDKWGRRHGIKYSDKANPEAQALLADYLTKDNARILQNKGIEPSDGNLYFAHFMGAPAASKAIQMLGKNAVAARSFPDAAKANPTIFFNNGKPRTIDEVYELITSKVV